MADKCRMYLLGLIILCPLLTGVSGEEVTRVFSSSDEDVSLPCNNVLSNCTSTTWNYNNHRPSSAVELFAGGIKKSNIERHERLSLGSDCSLNIYKATVNDCGDYNCQQFVNGRQHYGNDAHVFLHVLQVSVSPSSTQTEIRPGSSLTLTCQLYSYEHCDTLVRFEGHQLVWVNQADVNLQTDSRYQILSSENCISTLTTRLQNEDNNTELRCLVKHKHEIKTSASYTVKIKESSTTTTQTTQTFQKTLSPSTTSTSAKQVIVIVSVIAALVLLLPVVLLWVICTKRAGRRQADNSVVENNGHYETINISNLFTPSTNEQTDDVTYSEVITSSKIKDKKNNVHSADNVTYAAIRGK